ELRADDDISLAFLGRFKLRPQPLDATPEIARQDERARLREQSMHFFLQPLDARAERHEGIRRSALRAGRRQRTLEAAMMTDEPPAMTVLDEPGIAVRATHAIAAS